MKNSHKNPADLAAHVLGLSEAVERLCFEHTQEIEGLEGLEAVARALRENAEELVLLVADPNLVLAMQEVMDQKTQH